MLRRLSAHGRTLLLERPVSGAARASPSGLARFPLSLQHDARRTLAASLSTSSSAPEPLEDAEADYVHPADYEPAVVVKPSTRREKLRPSLVLASAKMEALEDQRREQAAAGPSYPLVYRPSAEEILAEYRLKKKTRPVKQEKVKVVPEVTLAQQREIERALYRPVQPFLINSRIEALTGGPAPATVTETKSTEKPAKLKTSDLVAQVKAKREKYIEDNLPVNEDRGLFEAPAVDFSELDPNSNESIVAYVNKKQLKGKSLEEYYAPRPVPKLAFDPVTQNFYPHFNSVWFPNIRIILTYPSFPDHDAKELHFRCPPEVTKHELRDYLTKVYGFDIKSINTMIYLGKLKYSGARARSTANSYRRPTYKKAIVTLR